MPPAAASSSARDGRPARPPRAWRASVRPRRSSTAASFARLPFRQLEVRFPSGGVTLSGTLTVPPGAGPHPAVAWVHGSGRTERAYLPDLQALLLHHGIAVLAYDKRGIGQSGGSYPGESPYPSTIDVLARDADAAVRFLAAPPGDRPRPRRACRPQPGRLDHPARRVAGAGGPVRRRLLRTGGDGGRERRLPEPDGRGNYAAVPVRGRDRRARARRRAGRRRPDPLDPRAPHPGRSGSTAVSTSTSHRASRRPASSRSRPSRGARSRSRRSRTRITLSSRPRPG